MPTILIIISICLIILRFVPILRPIATLYLPPKWQWLPSALTAAAAALSTGLQPAGTVIDNVAVGLSVTVTLLLAAQKGLHE